MEGNGGAVGAHQFANEFLAIGENQDIRIGLGGGLRQARSGSHHKCEAARQ